jgi:hypothetical protein
MKKASVPKSAMRFASVAALIATLTAVGGTAEARARRHWHHYDGGDVLYGDCSASNRLSPPPFIYPAANWVPFFHRVRHAGPILYLPAPSCESVAATALGPTISALD